jgi:hypothetical protein
MTQDEKVFMNMAGEFAVAAELNRRKFLASVTYGASKSADVFALSKDLARVVRIEVKTTSKKGWVVGQRALDSKAVSDDVFWVLAHAPELAGDPLNDRSRDLPAMRFFVLSSSEVHHVARAQSVAYNAKYKAKHKKDYDDAIGVPKIRLDAVLQFESRWDKIKARLQH